MPTGLLYGVKIIKAKPETKIFEFYYSDYYSKESSIELTVLILNVRIPSLEK